MASLIDRKKLLDSILRYFGPDKNLETITQVDAEQFKQPLLKSKSTQRPGTGLSKATVNKHCKEATALFSFAVRNNWLGKNPFKNLKLPSRSNRTVVLRHQKPN